MNITTDPANPWSEAKVYTFGELEVAVIRAERGMPVRYYTEIHRYGVYVMSLGSKALTRWGAVWQALWHDCPKEELGYRCRHSITKQGTVECGSAGYQEPEDDDE